MGMGVVVSIGKFVTNKNKGNIMEEDRKKKVFVSYSRKDSEWLDMIRRHFTPLSYHVEFWDDTKIKPGSKWKEEIESALEQADVALLLLSADFFSSEFILNEEVPKLLKAANEKGVLILAILINHCIYEFFPNISQYQFLNDPKIPIASMNKAEIEKIWADAVRLLVQHFEIKPNPTNKNNNIKEEENINRSLKIDDVAPKQSKPKCKVRVRRVSNWLGAGSSTDVSVYIDKNCVIYSLDEGETRTIEVDEGYHYLSASYHYSARTSGGGGHLGRNFDDSDTHGESNIIYAEFKSNQINEFRCGFFGLFGLSMKVGKGLLDFSA